MFKRTGIRLRSWWHRFTVRYRDKGLIVVSQPHEQEPMAESANTSSARINAAGEEHGRTIESATQGESSGDRNIKATGEKQKNSLIDSFPVGFHSSAGPAVSFQHLEITPRYRTQSLSSDMESSATTSEEGDRDWRLLVKTKNSQSTSDRQYTIVHYRNRIFVSAAQPRSWSPERFLRASVLTRDSARTMLLALSRVARLDKHIITGHVVPFLEDYDELPNFGQVLLRVVPSDPYPHMALDLTIRQRLIRNGADGSWNDAQLDREADLTSLTRTFVRILTVAPHAFTTDCSFGKAPSPSQYLTLLKQTVIWDK